MKCTILLLATILAVTSSLALAQAAVVGLAVAAVVAVQAEALLLEAVAAEAAEAVLGGHPQRGLPTATLMEPVVHPDQTPVMR